VGDNGSHRDIHLINQNSTMWFSKVTSSNSGTLSQPWTGHKKLSSNKLSELCIVILTNCY